MFSGMLRGGEGARKTLLKRDGVEPQARAGRRDVEGLILQQTPDFRWLDIGLKG